MTYAQLAIIIFQCIMIGVLLPLAWDARKRRINSEKNWYEKLNRYGSYIKWEELPRSIRKMAMRDGLYDPDQASSEN